MQKVFPKDMLLSISFLTFSKSQGITNKNKEKRKKRVLNQTLFGFFLCFDDSVAPGVEVGLFLL